MGAAFIVVAATRRSGSYFFCDLLRQTGQLGLPVEYAIPTDTVNWGSIQGFAEYEEYRRQLISRHSTPNGVCSLKFMSWQFEHFCRSQRPGHSATQFAEIANSVGRVSLLRLSRRDQIAQAVSLALAVRTGVWNTLTPARRYISAELLSVADLRDAWLAIQREYKWWDGFFRHTPLPHLPIYYEDLCNEPDSVIAQCFGYTGISDTGHRFANPLRQKLIDIGTQHASDRLRGYLATNGTGDYDHCTNFERP
jgi:LPS sulfotransferase NodH